MKNRSQWEELKQCISVGSTIDVVVVTHEPFGVLVSIGESGHGVLERLQMEKVGYNTPEDYPEIGHTIQVVVLGFRNWSQQVEVGLESRK